MQKTSKSNTALILLSILLWAPILFFDSVYFANHYFDGKMVTTALVLTLSVFLFSISNLKLRLSILLIIPLSWLGEYIFSDFLDMYDYRDGRIPLYVPFGHACIYAQGWLLSNSMGIFEHKYKIKTTMLILFGAIFAWAILIFGDTLSLALGVLFFWALHRKNYNPFYFVMSFIVLALELVGTHFGCWLWEYRWSIFSTVNPPVGAMFIYIGGDILLNKTLKAVLRWRKGLRAAV